MYFTVSSCTSRIKTAPDIISLCARLGQAWQADASRDPSPFATILASLAGISSPGQHLLALSFLSFYHARKPQVLLLVSATVEADAGDMPRRIVGPYKGWLLITCLHVTSHRHLIAGPRSGTSKKIHVCRSLCDEKPIAVRIIIGDDRVAPYPITRGGASSEREVSKWNPHVPCARQAMVLANQHNKR